MIPGLGTKIPNVTIKKKVRSMYTRFLATCPGDPKSKMDWSNNYGELPGLETRSSAGKGPGQGLGLCWARGPGHAISRELISPSSLTEQCPALCSPFHHPVVWRSGCGILLFQGETDLGKYHLVGKKRQLEGPSSAPRPPPAGA